MAELEKSYDASKVEADIYQKWIDSGYFNPDNLPDAETREPYTIIMPPPNANAPLHVGHALFATIEDILIRYQRMLGKKALWQPGMDHAGFETQVVYEKKLDKEGRSRFQMTREEFYKEVWDFVQANKHISEKGLRRLGASCDWSRNIFTLNPEIIKIVYQTFKQMYEDGLVYRSGRICNWCPKHQTGLADLETKYEEQTDKFYYLKYGPFTIGTARPETKFGDKYVVMHPDDKHYAEYTHGQQIELEWINGPITATVIRDKAADMEFGTGVMTITPAHDATDFDIAKRHNLDIEQIIDKRGKLLPIAGEFAGLKIADAREKIIEKLQGKGLVEKIDENYKHNVQMCYKCGNIIEPQIVDQWYIKMTEPLKDGRPSLRDMALQALDKKEVEILTERFEKIFRHWMTQIRDWPISRQIWWGIPLPVWYCQGMQNEKCKSQNGIIIATETTPTECLHCHSKKIVQDPDTFDTWFSSGQWPYATLMANDARKGLKINDQGSDFATYFPTQVMETGWDILFFWVARMIMLSYYKTGKPPFQKVYLHGLVRDKDRQKMSKSKGNVIDPLGVIDTYGTDALRFALIFSTSAGNDIPLAEEKIKGMKHFANKLWNISRFIITNLSPSVIPDSTSSSVSESESIMAWAEPEAKLMSGIPESRPQNWILNQVQDDTLTDADKEILKKLNDTIRSATANLDKYNLHEAAQDIYQFTWHEFADIYIEKSKEQMNDEKLAGNTKKILLHSEIHILKLLHPFMPFITEHIWQLLDERKLLGKSDLLMISEWPKA